MVRLMGELYGVVEYRSWEKSIAKCQQQMHVVGKDTLYYNIDFVYIVLNSSLIVPIGPFRCFAIINSIGYLLISCSEKDL